MRFEWDAEKRRANLLKHGIDFAAASQIAWARAVIFEDDRHDYGEERRYAYVSLRGRVVVIVYTMRGDVCRVISLRKANSREAHVYATAPDDRRER